MAEIAHALGKDSDAVSYGVSATVTGLRQKAKLPQDQAASLFNSWLSLATSSSGSRLLGGYGNETSWSLMYNLFADKMLGLNLVPQSVSPELKEIYNPYELVAGHRHADSVFDRSVGNCFRVWPAH